MIEGHICGYSCSGNVHVMSAYADTGDIDEARHMVEVWLQTHGGGVRLIGIEQFERPRDPSELDRVHAGTNGGLTVQWAYRLILHDAPKS